MTQRTPLEALRVELRFIGPAALVLFAAGFLITFPFAFRAALRHVPKE